MTELGAFILTEVLSISVLRVASGPRVKLAGCTSALTHRRFILLTILRRWSRCCFYYLLLCSVLYSCFKSCLVLFCSCVFSPLSISITLLGEERVHLIAFRKFVQFAFVCFFFFFFFFSVSSSSWCLGRAVASDCGIPRTFLFPFLCCYFM